MPDHQVLEAGYLFRSLLHLDFAIFGFQCCESPGCGKNQFRSRNTPRSRSGAASAATECEHRADRQYVQQLADAVSLKTLAQ